MDVKSGHDIDFINETAIQIHPRSSDNKKAKYYLASSAAVDQVYILKGGGEGGQTCSIKEMATDESVVVSSGDSTSINIVDSSNQAASATPDEEGVVAPEETYHPDAQSPPPPAEAYSTTSDGGVGGVVEGDEVAVFQSNNKITTNNIITKGGTPSATAPVPQMLPNTVIAVVQPTTRTNSNYVRINTNPAKAREPQQSHYVAVPAQRVVVAATSGQQQHQSHNSGTATKQHHSQGPRRLGPQVSYGPGITIHHCQPGPGGGGPPVGGGGGATMSAQPVWPIVDPVFHFGAGFEPPSRPYCPTHEPQPQEHVVMFHVHPGVSVSFQIGGNQEIVRGKWRI